MVTTPYLSLKTGLYTAKCTAIYKLNKACLHCVYGTVVGGMLAVVGVLCLIRIKVMTR